MDLKFLLIKLSSNMAKEIKMSLLQLLFLFLYLHISTIKKIIINFKGICFSSHR